MATEVLDGVLNDETILGNRIPSSQTEPKVS